MEETSRKYVIITGFGPFNGVSANPTEVLIQRLQQDETDLDIHYHVLPVSVDAVDGFHGSLDKEALVYIHLGVNGSATAMHLERTAYNNMDFRCPDECGYQPEQCLISQETDLDAPLLSCLPIDDIVTLLCADGYDCKVSDDPGRFLCNYVYYRSLVKTKRSIFIHVPHFEHIDAEVQVRFVKSVIKVIVNGLQHARSL